MQSADRGVRGTRVHYITAASRMREREREKECVRVCVCGGFPGDAYVRQRQLVTEAGDNLSGLGEAFLFLSAFSVP